jgi:hypothetical protein
VRLVSKREKILKYIFSLSHTYTQEEGGACQDISSRQTNKTIKCAKTVKLKISELLKEGQGSYSLLKKNG